MDALILDGALAEGTDLEPVAAALSTALERAGQKSRMFRLRRMKIRPCNGCFLCWQKTPGECVIDDEGRTVAAAIVASGLVVLLTPITFGGYSSQLKKAIDRAACPLLLPFFTKINGEVHHHRRYERYPNILAVGIDDGLDRERGRIFTTLVGRNAINFHAERAEALTLSPKAEREEMERRFDTALAGLVATP